MDDDGSSSSLETYDEFLDRLNLSTYKTKLVDEGFDTVKALATLEEDDLVDFMKKGHRRVLLKELQYLRHRFD